MNTACPRICVIGAGPSGLAAIKNLQQQGLSDITVFEKNNQIGGNWVYEEHNQHSSVYETTHIISSNRWSQYEDFPFPIGYPDYPSHALLLEYFQSYASHFKLYQYIKFNTEVLKAVPVEGQQWLVIFKKGDEIREAYFDYLLVANGHHWDPYQPSYPGSFNGEILHSHQYKNSLPFKNKRVLVVGGGNSACDLAVEIARVANKSSISMRRGYHIFPKFIFGKATDVAFARIKWLPVRLRQYVIQHVIRIIQGRYEKYRLMEPTSRPLETHPTINSELLYFIRHGKVKPHPGIDAYAGDRVHFANGSSDKFDVIIFATGYKISFPFFDPSIIDFNQASTSPLYRKMIHRDYDNLYFIGFCQPQGCIWPLADYQAKVAARIIAGKLKRPDQLHQKIAKELKNPHYRYQPHPRHVLEVDYHKFRKELVEML